MALAARNPDHEPLLDCRSLPAFISPNVLNVLVENFDIKPIAASPREDLDAILGK